MAETARLRIRAVNPTPGVAYGLQRGSGGKADVLELQKAAEDGDELVFEFTVQVAPGASPGATKVTGPFAQGSPADRFVYLVIPDEGRVKVPVSGIPWKLAERASADATVALEAAFNARNAKGRPVLASVRLIGDGWSVA